LSNKPVVCFQYHPTRAGAVAKEFLEEYQGVVQSDGYSGYDFLDLKRGVLHVACWAHARRKFMAAKKAGDSKKVGSADKALAVIRSLYRLEKGARNKDFSPEEIYEMRQKEAKPILKDYKEWLETRRDQVPPKSLLGKAINYSLNQWYRLENYIKDGNAGIDNNVVENAIRPFVIGRKNWLFSGTPEGANASALLYSLIETAKANKLEPYKYLRFLFEKLPTTPGDQLKTLLPTRLKPANIILDEVATGV
jgi:transposase